MAKNGLVVPATHTGTVYLPSGTWVWRMEVDGDRFRLRFNDSREPLNEMLAYCRRATVTEEVVAACARDPLCRYWSYPGGSRWMLRMESPSWIWTGAWSQLEVGSDLAWLVFARGRDRRFAWTSRHLSVGALTNEELTRLLGSSRPVPWPEITQGRIAGATKGRGAAA